MGVCLGYFRGLDCPSPSHGGLPIGIPAFLSGSLTVALSHLVGSGSFASLDVLPVRSSGLSGAFVALPGSLLFILPGFGSLSSQFPVVGLVLCSLPCGPAPGISLFGLMAVPPFLLSRFVAVCFPGLWVSLFPGSFLVLGSSFPVLVFYSFLLRGTRGGIWFLPSAPLGCFIQLSLTSGLLFLFLATAFPTVQLVPRFLSYFSDLVFCSSQSCLGLQWFWSSCPFRCWGSRLPLPIAVFRISSRGLCSFLFPDFVPGWFVLRLLRWYSAVSSCFPAFSRLADPCYFYSLALSLLYSWRLCSSCFPPSRFWSYRLAFHSVTVPLVYSLLLLECSYSPQLFCGSSWVSASCLAPVFGGSLTRVYLFCVFGLYRFGLLPFLLLRCLTAGWLFPLAGLLLDGCIRSLVPRSSTVVLCSVACLQSDFPTLAVVMLFPPSSFRTPSVSVGCVPGAFAMGSP